MEIYILWDIVQRRWWLILLPAIVVFLWVLPSLPDAIAGGTDSYSVAMRFTAASEAEALPDTSYEDSAYVPWLASEYVVVNLPQWITSDTFAREVSRELAIQNLDIPYEDIRSVLVADSARSVFVVYIGWDDAEEIEAIANAVVKVLQTRNQDYFPQFAAHPAQVEPLDDVRVNSVAPPLMDRLNPFLRLAVGLAAGFVLAIVAEYFDDRIRGESDLQAMNLEVLGSVPKE